MRRLYALSLFAACVMLSMAHAAEPGQGSTKGIVDFKKPKSVEQLVGPTSYSLVPESDAKCQWVFNSGVLTASPMWDSVITKDMYQDFRMHVEFNVNDVPGAKPEANGNSGVYIQQRYELQILNSFGIAKADYKASYCGSLYKQKMPDELACKKAGEWQTYDIVFRGARFTDGKKTANARITAYHNGTLIHDDHSIARKTGAGKKEGPEPGPIKLQGHKNQVRFRNVWIQRLELGAAKKKAAAPAPKKKKKGYTYVIPFDDIPPAPALKPKDALKTFVVHEDFALEIAANDPQIQNPLALRFDGNGRMWVVEMRAYMPNAKGEGEEEPIGRISILEDTTGDGYFDAYKVFLDGLVLPRSIAFYKSGILYGGHEKLYFVENNNDKAGEMTVIDEAYNKDGNVEHRSNGLFRGLDNWIYSAKSDARYREIDGKWIKEKTTFRGQWGISQNNYGRLHYNQNWFGMKADQLLPNTLQRNPNFLRKTSDVSTLSYRDKIYPARITPGVNRGGEGAIDDKGYLTAVTAACGPVRYRGHQFPEKYRDIALFCEPSAHFVRMINISETDGMLTGEHRLKEREFLASTDERFRPVNLHNAPDGSVYLVDLYHGVLQHKRYLTPYLMEHVMHRNLESQPRLGRVYRIKYRDNPLGKAPKMLGKAASELIPFLAHESGWWRDAAQQLIIDSGDKDAVAGLNALAADTKKPLGQIHALWTLEGLDAVNSTAVAGAMRSTHPYVLESAIRIAEHLPAGRVDGLIPQLATLAARSEPVILRQLAASLGRMQSDGALPLLKTVLTNHLEIPLLREAAISGLAGKEQAFKDLLGPDFKDAKFNDYLKHCLTLKTTAGAFKAPGNKDHLAAFQRGEKFFVTNCMACHGADGKGIENLGPPLVASEWVQGSSQRLAAILLQGMMGPITVAGKTYTPVAAMPGLKSSPGITDQQLADVATFTRHAWNNRKGLVKPQTIADVRKKLADRATTFTAEELQKTFP